MDPRLNQGGPTLIVLAEHKPPVYSQDGLSLVTSSVRRSPPDCLDPKIHHNNLLSSILAKIEANIAAPIDALMLDVRGFVAETNATHVFIVEHGKVRTPRTVACPEGITRSAVLELCASQGIESEACDLSLAEVYRGNEMFCTARWASWRRSRAWTGASSARGVSGPTTEVCAGSISGADRRVKGRWFFNRPSRSINAGASQRRPRLSTLAAPPRATPGGRP
jgi:branched-chain amino acid aminotransferase